MPTVEVSAQTLTLIRLAARLGGVSEDELVARAVAVYADPAARPEGPASLDPWEPVAVYGTHRGTRVDAQFLPKNGRVRVTSGPRAGCTFRTPSGAAQAVVLALNPGRGAAHTNGWRFWRFGDDYDGLAGVPIDVLRAARRDA